MNKQESLAAIEGSFFEGLLVAESGCSGDFEGVRAMPKDERRKKEELLLDFRCETTGEDMGRSLGWRLDGRLQAFVKVRPKGEEGRKGV